MKARRTIIEEANANLAVSIHQNSYVDASVFGAQVFYYEASDEGKCLAETIQAEFQEHNPKNHRSAKSNTNYYILKSGSCPTIICECGFLSNEEESALLNTSTYQDEIANAIFDGILSYLSGL